MSTARFLDEDDPGEVSGCLWKQSGKGVGMVLPEVGIIRRAALGGVRDLFRVEARQRSGLLGPLWLEHLQLGWRLRRQVGGSARSFTGPGPQRPIT